MLVEPQQQQQEQEQDDLVQCPISSKRDLTNLCEVYDEGEKFLRSTFSLIDCQGRAWFGQALGIRKYDLTVEDLRSRLRRLPDHRIYPLQSEYLVTATTMERGDQVYIKRPKVLYADNEFELELVPRLLFEEAEVLDHLRGHCHPNIIKYYGCEVNRGYITGLVLEKHNVILQYWREDFTGPLDVKACLEAICAGVRHLHGLGYAHNDLNPTNIALDDAGNPIILDFGSCKKFGEKLITGGTPGWIDENYTTSAARHDDCAIKKLEVWLKEEQEKHLTGNDAAMT